MFPMAISAFPFLAAVTEVTSSGRDVPNATIVRPIKRSSIPSVSAIIELNVVPKADLGFEEVAEKVASYSQVEAVYLMSGGYDLNVVVKGKNLQEVSRFVARELATIDSVTSTATHFVMRRYKELDVELVSKEEDDRGQLWI